MRTAATRTEGTKWGGPAAQQQDTEEASAAAACDERYAIVPYCAIGFWYGARFTQKKGSARPVVDPQQGKGGGAGEM